MNKNRSTCIYIRRRGREYTAPPEEKYSFLKIPPKTCVFPVFGCSKPIFNRNFIPFSGFPRCSMALKRRFYEHFSTVSTILLLKTRVFNFPTGGKPQVFNVFHRVIHQIAYLKEFHEIFSLKSLTSYFRVYFLMIL